MKNNDTICSNCGGESILTQCTSTGGVKGVHLVGVLIFGLLGWVIFPIFWILALLCLVLWIGSYFIPKTTLCPHCKSKNLIPIDSPMGQKLKKDMK